MTYCTQDDLINTHWDGEQQLIQLTDTLGSGTVNLAVLNAIIARADAEINGYLAAYLPFSDIPANLVYLACDICWYHLYSTQKNEKIDARYQLATDYLRQVALGKITLAPSVTGAVEAPSTDTVAFVSAATVFSRGVR